MKRRRKNSPVIKQVANNKKEISECKENFIKKQKGVCPLCGAYIANADRPKLHIDHDHKTGMVRGVLCSGCNRAEGKIKGIIQRLLSKIEIDFEDFIKNMIDYWKFHKPIC